MRIAKVQQSSRQVVASFGERNPKGQRMLVGRHGAVIFAQVHQRVAKMQPGSGVDRVECRRPLEPSCFLADLPPLGVGHALRVRVVRAPGIEIDRAVQGGDRLLRPACLVENRRRLTQPFRAISVLRKGPATIGRRATRLREAFLDKPAGFYSDMFHFICIDLNREQETASLAKRSGEGRGCEWTRLFPAGPGMWKAGIVPLTPTMEPGSLL